MSPAQPNPTRSSNPFDAFSVSNTALMATTIAPFARIPFAPLDNPRLQHLASSKNSQNGFLSSPSKTDSKLGVPSIFSSPKRSFEETFDDDDSENVDPEVAASPSKRCKTTMLEAKAVTPFTFMLHPERTPMGPPSVRPSRPYTPLKGAAATRTPSTAPAGRSPPRKTTAGFLKPRRISAPFSRIDPPRSWESASSLPFSIDAALSGSVLTPRRSRSPARKKAALAAAKKVDALLDKAIPKTWFFDIHQDTPDEEAGNLMEHSTLTLDLSSDDEDSPSRRARDDRGKENTPPESYDAAAASRPVENDGSHVASPLAAVENVADFATPEPAVATASSASAKLVRKKKLAVDDMDDGERTPLSELEPEPLSLAERAAEAASEEWEDF